MENKELKTKREEFTKALETKNYELALHIISLFQEEGLGKCAVQMTKRLDLAQGRDFDAGVYTELESEKWSNLRRDNFSPILV